MSPRKTCLNRCIVALVAFVWFFSRVSFHMSPQMACVYGCKVALVAFVWFFPGPLWYIGIWSFKGSVHPADYLITEKFCIWIVHELWWFKLSLSVDSFGSCYKLLTAKFRYCYFLVVSIWAKWPIFGQKYQFLVKGGEGGGVRSSGAFGLLFQMIIVLKRSKVLGWDCLMTRAIFITDDHVFIMSNCLSKCPLLQI